jgi:hypothetical protein
LDGYDEERTNVRRTSAKDRGKLIYYDCKQYSVLSPVELGLDQCYGRMIFYPLCEEIYQVVNNNAAGQLFADYFIWKVDTKKRFRVPTLQIEAVPE